MTNDSKKILEEAKEILAHTLDIKTSFHYSKGGPSGLIVKVSDLNKLLKFLTTK